IRLFSYDTPAPSQKPEHTTGIHLHAATGKVQVQAQRDQANLNAQQTVTISSNNQVTLASPTQLKLVANGTGLTLKDGNILIQCPKEAMFKASLKQQLGPMGASHTAPPLPKSQIKGCEFSVSDATQSGAAGTLR
ncbi:DUF2345 domain-containing protein, partial [Chitinivorax sp. B]|uniref:DUF2345 domain-containing protein n=1 Tax=Chitinivorax sp. B TaxID=2502235 RepID=UPI001485787E